MIAFLVAALVATTLAVWVIRGFFSSQEHLLYEIHGDIPYGERKYGIYRSILDLEEDFEVGKVTPEDRETLMAQYEAEAITFIRETKRAESTSEDEVRAELEREIAAARSSMSSRTRKTAD